MPSVAVYNDTIISVEDIYKYDIDKKSVFKCFECDNILKFRQCRNADSDSPIVDHFYHQNNTKDTHITCETPISKITVNRNNVWHTNLSSLIKKESREVIRKDNANKKHIVDVFCKQLNRGVEFQHSHISTDDIQSRDKLSELDWIFDVSDKWSAYIKIGNYTVCEIPHSNWEEAVKVCKNNVFLDTGKNEWVILKNKDSYRIECNGIIRNVWIGQHISVKNVIKRTCLKNTLLPIGFEYFESFSNNHIDTIDITYGRCIQSMSYLDDIHRNYVNSINFDNPPNEVLAIKSVAGSGKTTTLLKIAQANPTKKFMYLAFNKSLVDEIKNKLIKNKITNLEPYTFDALIYRFLQLYYYKGGSPNIIDLRPVNIGNFISWFDGKPFGIKKAYCTYFLKFCKSTAYTDISKMYPGKKLLTMMWEKTVNHNLITYDGLRKLAHSNHWLKDNIDKAYNGIFIDEAQDFDPIMLDMLLSDTTIPKLFVGDPRQAIYEWRGCVNSFDNLPDDSLIIEFYSTFRIGEPACSTLRNIFKDCWMISKADYSTELVKGSPESIAKYTYLFRSWRELFLMAKNTKNIWIYSFDKQIELMKKLHTALHNKKSKLTQDESESFADDLPKFLLSISASELNDLIVSVNNNYVSKNTSECEMYTIHSFKGLEDNIVKVHSDCSEKDINLYYVALTRGKDTIYY